MQSKKAIFFLIIALFVIGNAYFAIAQSNYSYEWALVTGGGTVEVKSGSRSITTFRIKNNDSTSRTYRLGCTPLGGELKQVSPEVSIQNGNGLGRITVSANTEKQLTYSLDVSGMTPNRQLNVNCDVSIYGEDNGGDPNYLDSKNLYDNIQLVRALSTAPDSPATVTLLRQGATQFATVKVEDPDGIKVYSVTKKGQSSSFSGSTLGAVGQPGECGSDAMVKIYEDQTSIGFLEEHFPLTALVTDCRKDATPFSVNVPAPSWITVNTPAPTPSPGTPATVNLINPGGTVNTKIEINDSDGIKEYAVTHASDSVVVTSGRPGAVGTIGACGGSSMFKTITSDAIKIMAPEFPLQASVTDCRSGATPFIVSISKPSWAPSISVPNPEASPECSDKRDNDFDGKTDYPADTGCSSAEDSSEAAAETPPPGCGPETCYDATYCTDKKDNDNDGFIDADDPGCKDGAPPPEPNPEKTQCADGLDNDSDGKTDYPADTGCYSASDDNETTGDAPGGGGGEVGAGRVTVEILRGLGDINYTITVEDDAYLKEYSINTASGKKVINANPGVPTGSNPCGKSSALKIHSFMAALKESDFPLKASITDCGDGTIDLTVRAPVDKGDTEPRACYASFGSAGDKCPKGSWCELGAQSCYYPDGQLTCLQYVQPLTIAPACIDCIERFYGPKCPKGTSQCKPADKSDPKSQYCVNPGEKGKYIPDQKESMADWCGNGLVPYYYPTPNDKGEYGMICNYPDEDPPKGYQPCRPDDKNCKQEGDEWRSGDFACLRSKKCPLASGGGTCVAYGQECPTKTLLCPKTTGPELAETGSLCVEPDSKVEFGEGRQTVWCAGGGIPFYVGNLAYCPPKNSKNLSTEMTATEIKAIIKELGSQTRLCNPVINRFSTAAMCGEPDETVRLGDWCAWYPPGYLAKDKGGKSKTCPALIETPSPCPASVTCFLNTKTGAKEAGACEEKSRSADWIKVPYEECKTKGSPEEEYRECRPSEFPDSLNLCSLPKFSWNLKDKKWEKCLAADAIASYVDVTTNRKATRTNCQTMNFELEEKWRSMRYQVRPPEKYGENYLPNWDATVSMRRYNPESDQFEPCLKEPYRMYLSKNQWISSCMSVPAEDAKWMLEMYRAIYKTNEFYAEIPTDTPLPDSLRPPLLESIESPLPQGLSTPQCKDYLLQIRKTVNSDQQFWKDFKQQLTSVPKEHPDLPVINDLLGQSKKLISDSENLARQEVTCTEEGIGKIREITNQLHQDVFPELSVYLGSLHNFVDMDVCRSNLEKRLGQLEELTGETQDEDALASIESLMEEIQSQEEVFSDADAAAFDGALECQEYLKELESRILPLVRDNDSFISRVVQELKAKVLPQGSDGQNAVIEQMVVQIAALQKALTELTDKAAAIAEKVAVSLQELAEIKDKFAKEKEIIQEAKQKLLPFVEETIVVIDETDCVKGGLKDTLIEQLGILSSLNLVGGQEEGMIRRLNTFIAACRQNQIGRSDIDATILDVERLRVEGQQDAVQLGLTPFADVPTYEWYFGAMSCAYDAGFMTQGRPGEAVLAQDALLMIMRNAGKMPGATECQLQIPKNVLHPNNVSSYAHCAVNEAYRLGVPPLSDMKVPVSRIKIADWLIRLGALQLSKALDSDPELTNSFVDLGSFNPDIKKPALYLAVHGIMTGDVPPGGTARYFRPNDPLSRAALATILDRLLAASGSEVCQ